VLHGGRHAYYRALRAFYSWLYSPKAGMGLNAQANPMLLVDAPEGGEDDIAVLSPRAG